MFKRTLLAAALAFSATAQANFFADLIAQTTEETLFGTDTPNPDNQYFARQSVFPIYRNLAEGDDSNSETVAEIIAASEDGNTIIYTDSEMERLGFVDISDISNPQAAGFLALSGEPTSVAVHGDWALVVINTSEDFVNTSGQVDVINISDISAPTLVRSLPLNGQPDSIAISPSGEYAAVAIENERDEDACANGIGGVYIEAQEDEDLCDSLGGEMGGLPQYPAGFVSKITMNGEPADWSVTDISLSGLNFFDNDDPETEYVDINGGNLAAISLQENNGMVVLNLNDNSIMAHYDASTVDLINVDATENSVIDPIDDLYEVAREPDAISWLSESFVVSANEGDYLGGSRSFTLFDMEGNVQYEAAADLEHIAISSGHFPEARASKKGIEPEGIEVAMINQNNLLFVGSERANVTAVYRVNDVTSPEFLQLLPTGVGPEGLLAIPSRQLLVVAAEVDSADDGIRSMLSLYEMSASEVEYPQISSSNSDELIGWGALSGLAADRNDANTLYTIHDSFYNFSRIYQMDVSTTPAQIVSSTLLHKDGELMSYDLEGISQREDGSFWLVSEGKPEQSNNLLIHALADGTVMQEITLPQAIQATQRKHGFEGVDSYGSGTNEKVYVAVQREWDNDPAGMTKIAVYSPTSQSWDFLYYPLTNTDTGWVGLSELTVAANGDLLIVERDNQQGDNANIKHLYRVTPANATEQGQNYPVLSKTLVRDFLPDLQASNGWVVDKLEGFTIAADGNTYAVTDNDGLDDATGETVFMRLGPVNDL